MEILFLVIICIVLICVRWGNSDVLRRSGGIEYTRIPETTISELPLYTNVTGKSSTFNKHHGQRKLLLTEISFIVHSIKKNKNKLPMLMVYAGAAPCTHFGVIMKLFPDIKFLLVDPREFLIMTKPGEYHITNDTSIVYIKSSRKVALYKELFVDIGDVLGADNEYYKKGETPNVEYEDIIKVIKESKHNVFLIEDFMTNDLAKALNNDHYFTIFMSDIRTGNGDGDKPHDIQVVWNNCQFFNWLTLLKPHTASHKHRMIFEYNKMSRKFITPIMKDDFEYAKNKGIDFMEDAINNKYRFFKGNTLLQPWISKNSSETRLIIDRDDIIDRDYDTPPKKIVIEHGPGHYIDIQADYKYNPPVDFTIPDIPYTFTEYDIIAYDQQLLYHNRHNKTSSNYKCDYVSDRHCICNCYDCALEAFIFEDYKNNTKSNMNIMGMMSGLHHWLGINDKSLCKVHKNK